MDPNSANLIFEASLDLLENPGVRIEHDKVTAQLLKAGAKAGNDAQVICFPKELVKESIAQAPSEVFFADRDGSGKTISAHGNTLNWTVPGMNILKENTHRRFTSTDMGEMAKLVEQLPNVDGIFGMALADMPTRSQDVVGLRVMAENTKKHIRVLCFTPEGADVLCEMKDVVGAYPWFSVGFTAHGPLRWTNLALEIFARTAGKGIPTTINGEPMSGASAPCTLAGAAAVGNAEILSGLVINQILEPGRPCIYNLGLAHIFDMRTSIAVTGAPENHLLADVSAALGRLYNLPSCSWVSTESMCVDSQASIEKTAGYFSHLNSGVSLIFGVGQLESELTISPAQAVIDNEIISYVRRYLRGIEVNPETLAVDVVRSVGIGGNFLAEDHTVRHFRNEFFEPSLLLRESREPWKRAGSKPLAQKAEEVAEKLVKKEMPASLSEDEARELRKLEDAFLKRLSTQAS
ncbi:MAG: trimethylamine methyltransferase family protein [SAR324 cluster bacterium]|nr:trimethylamine methyltransferase family protein [SAR324 cluster bacterium]